MPNVVRVSRVLTALGCVAFLFGAPNLAAAQDAPRIGLMVSSPGDVGVLWRVTDGIAIRPSMSFRWASYTNDFQFDPRLLANLGTFGGSRVSIGTPGDDLSVSSLVVNLDVSVQFTISERDRLRVYVAPEFGHAFARDGGIFGDISSSEASNFQLSGLVGLQYGLNERFGVFGETGLQFGYSSSQSPVFDVITGVQSTSSITSIGSASRVGLVFSF